MMLDHRLPAILAALFSSIAVLTAAVSGASCNFLLRFRSDGEGETVLLEGIAGSFGVLCEHEIFPREGDRMWELSRIFLVTGLTLGSLTAALAWAVATFLTPSGKNWTGISVLAAITAVIQVPIFILFEAEPCMGDSEDIDLFRFNNDTTGLGCKLGPGSYLLIVSDLFYIAVTIMTQCFDKPRWGLELDLWRVSKRGTSRRYRSVRNRKYNPNDDDDDDGKYGDAVHLTGLRARSIISSHSSDEGDEDAFTSISRVLPAGEAKQAQLEESPEYRTKTTKKQGFFSRLFGSPIDNMEVPAGETHSVSVDDEYDYENQLLHNLEIVRVMPPKTGRDSSAPRSEPGEGQEVSIETFDRFVSKDKEATDRNFQSFEAVVENDRSSNLKSLMDTGLSENATASNGVVEQHHMIDSPSASFVSMEKIPIVSSVQNILDDLRCEEMTSGKQCKPETFEAAFLPQGSECLTDANANATGPETVVKGVRRFTNKLKSVDSKRSDGDKKSSFRKLNIFSNKQEGYAQMNSDQSSDDIDFDRDENHDDGFSENVFFNHYIDEPSPGLQLQVNHPQNDVKPTSTTVIPGVQDDDIEGIYSSLDQSNDNVDDNSILQSTDDSYSKDNTTPFDCISIGSTHSDPGPISFDGSFFEESTGFTPFFTPGELDSDQSTSFTDLFRERSEEGLLWCQEIEADSTSLTTDSSSASSHEASRGRATTRSDARRKRRPISPVGSVQSRGSLLHMTIDEETEEDIKNELEPNSTYSLKRTLSCPEQRPSVGPISTRRDKSTAELLKKLERLKHSIKTDLDESSSPDLPPSSPTNDIVIEGGTNPDPDESFGPMDEMSADNSSAVLSELLMADHDDSTAYETADEFVDSPNGKEIYSSPQAPSDDHSLPNADPIRKNLWDESEPQDDAQPPNVPETPGASANKDWKDLISPMKDTPSKESWKELVSRAAAQTPSTNEHWKKLIKNHTPSTADVSDETSDTGRTRSTISYDSDDDSYEAGPRQIRSKSLGRPRKKPQSPYRSSSSLSPTRRNRKSREGSGGGATCLRPSNLSSLARESRIRRLQQLRKGYLPLVNDHHQEARSTSPEPFRRGRRGAYGEDPLSDPELTPKRKTAVTGVGVARNDSMTSDDTSTGELPNGIFQPSLLLDDPDEPCPEFDDIMDHLDLHQLDLQLIDLNRPMGAEYGADEKSM
mmetsp:Transcript_19917/g.46753  ORF Transcript_19917/g.46753 Transcript_19917/m.46753 type:complete len:1188 (+) Transcript_19917:232-3795(+)